MSLTNFSGIPHQMKVIYSTPFVKPKPIKFMKQVSHRNISCKIFQHEHFLTDKQCDYIIQNTDKYIRFNKIYTNNLSSVCNNGNDIFFQGENQIKNVDEKLEYFITGYYGHTSNMLMHVTKYEPGQNFEYHTDPIKQTGEYYINKFTSIVYLNDNFEGGETVFPHLGISIKPKTGKLVCWYNMKSNEVNEDMAHYTNDTQGDKYVAVKMFN